jgi:hypothetical protein
MNQSTSHLKMANPHMVKEIVLHQDLENKAHASHPSSSQQLSSTLNLSHGMTAGNAAVKRAPHHH